MASGTPAQSTRAYLEQLFNDMAAQGTRTALPPALSEDLIWTATNTSPLAGRYVGKQAYLDQVLGVLGGELDRNAQSSMTLEQIIVDEGSEWATVRFRTEGAKGKNGTDFSMSYCWVMRVGEASDSGGLGRIKEVIGFYDGAKMYRLFDQDVK